MYIPERQGYFPSSQGCFLFARNILIISMAKRGQTPRSVCPLSNTKIRNILPFSKSATNSVKTMPPFCVTARHSFLNWQKGWRFNTFAAPFRDGQMHFLRRVWVARPYILRSRPKPRVRPFRQPRQTQSIRLWSGETGKETQEGDIAARTMPPSLCVLRMIPPGVGVMCSDFYFLATAFTA